MPVHFLEGARSLLGMRPRTLREASGSVRRVRPAPRDAAREAETEARPDTFVLTRIIGNDLVPRHAEGQSLANLRFILDHEPPLEGCEKRFIVNRIFDEATRAAVVAELDARNQAYIEIPFDWDAFARTGYDFSPFPPGFFRSSAFLGEPDEERQRALVRTYAVKNRYVMNNNGARNAALADGRGRAKWVLPWDGNCFVTEGAWAEIRAAVAAAKGARYLIVPMARITDNARLLEPGFRPEATEEPQVAFRSDAEEVFDERQVYGRRPKVELFCRLGIEGPWGSWRLDPWDVPPRPVSPEAHRVAHGGWVARLFSGQARAETADKVGFLERGSLRRAAIMRTIDRAETILLARQGFDPAALQFYDPARLEAAGRDDAWTEGARRGAEELGSNEGALQDPLRAVVALAVAHAATGERAFRDRAEAILQTWLERRREAQGRSLFAEEGLHELLDAVRLLGPSPATRELGALLREELARADGSPEGRAAVTARPPGGVLHDLDLAAAAVFLGDTGRLVEIRHRALSRMADHFPESGGRQPGDAAGAGAAARHLQTWIDLMALFERAGFPAWATGEAAPLRDAALRFLAWAETAKPAGFDLRRLVPLRVALGFTPADLGAGLPVFPAGTGIAVHWELVAPAGWRSPDRPGMAGTARFSEVEATPVPSAGGAR